MQRILFIGLLCVVAGCWLSNVCGTLSKKDKKNKKNTEPARVVSACLLFLLSDYSEVLK